MSFKSSSDCCGGAVSLVTDDGTAVRCEFGAFLPSNPPKFLGCVRPSATLAQVASGELATSVLPTLARGGGAVFLEGGSSPPPPCCGGDCSGPPCSVPDLVQGAELLSGGPYLYTGHSLAHARGEASVFGGSGLDGGADYLVPQGVASLSLKPRSGLHSGVDYLVSRSVSLSHEARSELHSGVGYLVPHGGASLSHEPTPSPDWCNGAVSVIRDGIGVHCEARGPALMHLGGAVGGAVSVWPAGAASYRLAGAGSSSGEQDQPVSLVS